MPKKTLHELPKAYEAKNIETALYAAWEKGGYFKPKHRVRTATKPFSIVLPPPNVTASLHLGSAFMLTVEDLMTRYHRLRGEETLWLPGTDHAAIATNYVVEKKILKEEGKIQRGRGRVWVYLLL